MNIMNNAAPTSSRGIEIDLARSARRHAIMQRVTDIYCRCGYSPYTLPLIDTHHSYANMLDDTDSLRSFRFVNNDGELMILRPDSTLFLVRHIAHTLQRDHLPLRVWYGESVLRNFSRAEGGIIEQYQSGVELIGKDDMEAEIEMLLFVRKTMRILELDDSVIHFGSRHMLRCVLMGCPEAQYRVVVNAVLRRDVRQLPALFMQAGYSQKEADDLTAFFMYIGSMPPPAPALQNKTVVHALEKELAQMKQIIDTVRESMSAKVPQNKQPDTHEGAGQADSDTVGQADSDTAGQADSDTAGQADSDTAGQANGDADIAGSTTHAIRKHIDTTDNEAASNSTHAANDNTRTATHAPAQHAPHAVHTASDTARTATPHTDDTCMTNYSTGVCVDLSEVGDRQYYTGFVFAVYHPRIADKIAAGGRYDTLFGMYGFDVSSIGFTVYIHKYEAYLDTPLQSYMDVDIANTSAGMHP